MAHPFLGCWTVVALCHFSVKFHIHNLFLSASLSRQAGRQDSVDTGGRRPGRMVGRNGWMIRRPSPNCSWGHNTLSIPTTGRLLSSAFILMCCCSAVQYAVKEKSSSDSHSGSGGGYNSQEIARPRHIQTGKSNWQGWVEEEEENNKTAHSAVL